MVTVGMGELGFGLVGFFSSVGGAHEDVGNWVGGLQRLGLVVKETEDSPESIAVKLSISFEQLNSGLTISIFASYGIISVLYAGSMSRSYTLEGPEGIQP